MNRNCLPLFMAAVAACMFSPATSAQYVGPSAAEPRQSVAAILAKPVYDQRVSLSGFLVRQIDQETYVFSDGAAEIQVEIDPGLFPATPVDEKTRVLIQGEVEKDLMQSPEIDVDRIELAD